MGKGKRGGSFGGGGGMGNMQQLMMQAKQMQSKMENIQEELAKEMFESQSGGGAVKATVNGKQEVVELTIDPEVLEGGDAEMLQDLVKAALNEAIKSSKEKSDEAMGGALGNLPFPPGMF